VTVSVLYNVPAERAGACTADVLRQLTALHLEIPEGQLAKRESVVRAIVLGAECLDKTSHRSDRNFYEFHLVGQRQDGEIIKELYQIKEFGPNLKGLDLLKLDTTIGMLQFSTMLQMGWESIMEYWLNSSHYDEPSLVRIVKGNHTVRL